MVQESQLREETGDQHSVESHETPIPLSPRPRDIDTRYYQPSDPAPRLWPALPPADDILKLPARLPQDAPLPMDLDSLL